MRSRCVKLFVFFCLFFVVNTFSVNAETEDVVVGFYEKYPYYYLDSRGNPKGYYHDVMELIAEKLNINFKYETLKLNGNSEKQENNEIDLLFGAVKSEENEKRFKYSKYIINNDVKYVFTNKNIEFGDLHSLDGLTFGYIPVMYNHKYFYDVLIDKGIDFQVKLAESNNQLKEWLKSGEIDFTIANGHDYFFREFKDIYMYALGASFIVTPNNTSLINRIDIALNDIYSNDSRKIHRIYNSYFNDIYKCTKYLIRFLIVDIIIVVIIILVMKSKKFFKKEKLSDKYLNYLHNDKFKLFYQPIINLKNDSIMGYEALLRLDDGEKILTPYHFLSEIEKLDIMYDITLWAIDKSLQDYHRLNLKAKDSSKVYVSINMSYKDLLHPNFINDVQAILSKYEEMEYALCFEITERASNSEFDSINKRIALLKSMGIAFAMDDFGTKYSNYDVLQEIDYDIVKLDKIFIDGYIDSNKKQCILKAILDILRLSGKRVVIEGTETLEQVNLIKALSEGKICAQGYYYSKPLPVDDLQLEF